MADNSSNSSEVVGQSSQELTVTTVMWLVFPPIYIFIGTIANLLAIVVFARKKLFDVTSTSYLIALAAADLSVLYTGLLPSWMARITESTTYDHKPHFLCQLLHWLDASTRDSSVWMLVAITADRVVACSFPLTYKIICTTIRARFVIAFVFLVTYTLNSHLLFGLEVQIYTSGNTSVALCAFSSDEYAKLYNEVIVTVDFLKFSLIPFILIVAGSIVIIYHIYKNKVARNRRVGPQDLPRRSDPASSVSTVLIALNVVFIICTSPLGLFMTIASMTKPGGVAGAMKGPVWAFVCMLLYLNNVLNFFTYILAGSRFRSALKSTVSDWISRNSTRVTLMNSGSAETRA